MRESRTTKFRIVFVDELGYIHEFELAASYYQSLKLIQPLKGTLTITALVDCDIIPVGRILVDVMEGKDEAQTQPAPR